MRKATPAEMDSRMGPADRILPLTEVLGAQHLALNQYELEPGDSMAYGFHAHERQEEIFFVVSGAVTFETDSGDELVEAGELVRFGPGEYQQGTNEGDERAVVLALGAPQDAGDTEILRVCEACGTRTPHGLSMAEDRSAILATCEECGSVTGRFT